MLNNPVGNGVPVSYIRCVAPRYANIDKSSAYAQFRPDWQYLEISTGHDAMVTVPGELAAMLLAVE